MVLNRLKGSLTDIKNTFIQNDDENPTIRSPNYQIEIIDTGDSLKEYFRNPNRNNKIFTYDRLDYDITSLSSNIRVLLGSETIFGNVTVIKELDVDMKIYHQRKNGKNKISRIKIFNPSVEKTNKIKKHSLIRIYVGLSRNGVENVFNGIILNLSTEWESETDFTLVIDCKRYYESIVELSTYGSRSTNADQIVIKKSESIENSSVGTDYSHGFEALIGKISENLKREWNLEIKLERGWYNNIILKTAENDDDVTKYTIPKRSTLTISDIINDYLQFSSSKGTSSTPIKWWIDNEGIIRFPYNEDENDIGLVHTAIIGENATGTKVINNTNTFPEFSGSDTLNKVPGYIIVNLVGKPSVELNDGMRIREEIEDTVLITLQTLARDANLGDISNTIYIVVSVTHLYNSRNGYTTSVLLSIARPNPYEGLRSNDTAPDDISTPIENAIEQRFIELERKLFEMKNSNSFSINRNSKFEIAGTEDINSTDLGNIIEGNEAFARSSAKVTLTNDPTKLRYNSKEKKTINVNGEEVVTNSSNEAIIEDVETESTVKITSQYAGLHRRTTPGGTVVTTPIGQWNPVYIGDDFDIRGIVNRIGGVNYNISSEWINGIVPYNYATDFAFKTPYLSSDTTPTYDNGGAKFVDSKTPNVRGSDHGTRTIINKQLVIDGNPLTNSSNADGGGIGHNQRPNIRQILDKTTNTSASIKGSIYDEFTTMASNNSRTVATKRIVRLAGLDDNNNPTEAKSAKPEILDILDDRRVDGERVIDYSHDEDGNTPTREIYVGKSLIKVKGGKDDDNRAITIDLNTDKSEANKVILTLIDDNVIIQSPNIEFVGDVTVTKMLTVTGSTTLDSTLTVTGDTDLNGALTVEGVTDHGV